MIRTCGCWALGEGDGEPERHRLDLGGNRRVNSVLQTLHITQARCHQPAKAYVAAKRAEHKTAREPAAPTSGCSPTSSSGACGPTTNGEALAP